MLIQEQIVECVNCSETKKEKIEFLKSCEETIKNCYGFIEDED